MATNSLCLHSTQLQTRVPASEQAAMGQERTLVSLTCGSKIRKTYQLPSLYLFVELAKFFLHQASLCKKPNRADEHHMRVIEHRRKVAFDSVTYDQGNPRYYK